MNRFYIATACLLAALRAQALSEVQEPEELLPDSECLPETMLVSLLQAAMIVEPAADSSHQHPAAVVPPVAAKATDKHTGLLETSERAAQHSSAASSITSFYLVRCHVAFQRVAGRLGSGVPLLLGVTVILIVFLIAILVSVYSPHRSGQWSASSPAQDLLIKPGGSLLQSELPAPSMVQDRRLPQNGAPNSVLSTRELAKPALPASGGGLLSSVSRFFGSPTTLAVPSTAPTSRYLMPWMVVQEAEGVQLFMDGALDATEQNGFLEVWRMNGDLNQRPVIRITFAEGSSGEGGHQNGILVELPSLNSSPVVFINTQFALSRPGHHSSRSKRHCTVFDTSHGNLDFGEPFCIAERESRGIVLRRVSGEALCCVSSGGYNTDFGNIVDDQGRLIATLSTRGPSIGVGMVAGPWKQNRRVVQISQGIDVVLVVCAIICATKLA